MNRNWDAISQESAVIITAAMWQFSGGVFGTDGRPILGEPGHEPNVYVTNVGPHGKPAFYLLAVARQIQPVVNAACNGATTANLYASGQYGELPQADQLAEHPDVKKYIVIVGGNDIGFADLFGCFVVEACENTSLPAQALAAAQNLGPALSKAYSALQQAAPHAHGVVVLYPPLLPPNGSSLTGCPYIDTAELAWGNKIEGALNNIIATTARADGLTVVDPSKLFVGHSLCAGQESWFYSPTQAGAGHPNLRGRGALAAAIAAQS